MNSTITNYLSQNQAFEEISKKLEDIIKTIQSFLNIRLVTDFDKGIQKFEPIKSKDKKWLTKSVMDLK